MTIKEQFILLRGQLETIRHEAETQETKDPGGASATVFEQLDSVEESLQALEAQYGNLIAAAGAGLGILRRLPIVTRPVRCTPQCQAVIEMIQETLKGATGANPADTYQI